MFLGVRSATPDPKWGRAPASPKFFGTPATYARTVWPRATKFDTVAWMWARRIFAGVSHAPSQGAKSQRPRKFSRPSTCVHTVWESTARFYVVIKLYAIMRGSFFYTVDSECWRRDLFAVANRLCWSRLALDDIYVFISPFYCPLVSHVLNCVSGQPLIWLDLAITGIGYLYR